MEVDSHGRLIKESTTSEKNNKKKKQVAESDHVGQVGRRAAPSPRNRPSVLPVVDEPNGRSPLRSAAPASAAPVR